MTPQELKEHIPVYRDGNIYMTDVVSSQDVEHCVMYGNEEPFIKESVRLICERVRPNSVRELGYGHGFSAQAFQDYGIERHIIYEPNDVIYKKALLWAKKKKGVEIVNARFEDAPNQDKVDLVFNDIYGMCNEEYQMANFGEVKEVFNFDWYAEFCTDYIRGEGIPEHYFRFKIREYDKLQLLIQNNNGNRKL